MEGEGIRLPKLAYVLPAYKYFKGNFFSIPIGVMEMYTDTIKKVLNSYEPAKETEMKAKRCVERFSYDFISRQQLQLFKKNSKGFFTFLHTIIIKPCDY